MHKQPLTPGLPHVLLYLSIVLAISFREAEVLTSLALVVCAFNKTLNLNPPLSFFLDILALDAI